MLRAAYTERDAYAAECGYDLDRAIRGSEAISPIRRIQAAVQAGSRRKNVEHQMPQIDVTAPREAPASLSNAESGRASRSGFFLY